MSVSEYKGDFTSDIKALDHVGNLLLHNSILNLQTLKSKYAYYCHCHLKDQWDRQSDVCGCSATGSSSGPSKPSAFTTDLSISLFRANNPDVKYFFENMLRHML